MIVEVNEGEGMFGAPGRRRPRGAILALNEEASGGVQLVIMAWRYPAPMQPPDAGRPRLIWGMGVSAWRPMAWRYPARCSAGRVASAADLGHGAFPSWRPMAWRRRPDAAAGRVASAVDPGHVRFILESRREDAMGTKIGRFASCAALALIMAVGFCRCWSLTRLATLARAGHGVDDEETIRAAGGKPWQALRRLAQDPALQERLGLALLRRSSVCRASGRRPESTLGRQRDALAQHEAELRALIGDAAASREAIEAEGVRSDPSARRDRAPESLDAVLDARDVPTQDQRVALRQAIRERRGERRGKRADGERRRRAVLRSRRIAEGLSSSRSGTDPARVSAIVKPEMFLEEVPKGGGRSG